MDRQNNMPDEATAVLGRKKYDEILSVGIQYLINRPSFQGLLASAFIFDLCCHLLEFLWFLNATFKPVQRDELLVLNRCFHYKLSLKYTFCIFFFYKN